jgi:hypothetical protein
MKAEGNQSVLDDARNNLIVLTRNDGNPVSSGSTDFAKFLRFRC